MGVSPQKSSLEKASQCTGLVLLCTTVACPHHLCTHFLHLLCFSLFQCIENYTGARCEEVFLPSSSIQIRSDLFTAFVALAVLGTLIIGALYFLCRISHHVVRSLNSTKNQLQLISQTAAAPTTRHLNKPSQTSSSVESLVDATFSYQLTTNTETPSRNCPAVIPQNRRATFRGPAPSSVTSAWWRRAALAPTTVMENTEEISQ